MSNFRTDFRGRTVGRSNSLKKKRTIIIIGLVALGTAFRLGQGGLQLRFRSDDAVVEGRAGVEVAALAAGLLERGPGVGAGGGGVEGGFAHGDDGTASIGEGS